MEEYSFGVGLGLLTEEYWLLGLADWKDDFTDQRRIRNWTQFMRANAICIRPGHQQNSVLRIIFLDIFDHLPKFVIVKCDHISRFE